MKRNPAVIISYLNMGNIYPVTEEHDGKNSLMGLPIKNSYNSHFVLTAKNGHVYNNNSDVICDEIVIGQESQILPAFIIALNVESCMKVYNIWERNIPKEITMREEPNNEKKYVSSVSHVNLDNSANCVVNIHEMI